MTYATDWGAKASFLKPCLAERIAMGRSRPSEFAATIAGCLAWPVVKLWSMLPVHCSLCGRANCGTCVAPGERMAWCSHCHRVFETPFFRAPGWVTGVLGFMLLNLQSL
jgi:hypothetical protein